jgi:hypothetical protein
MKEENDEDEKVGVVPAPANENDEDEKVGVVLEKMSVLRRHRILSSDVRRVLGHLKAHDKITSNDILSRPRLRKKRGASAEEPIPWAHAELKGNWQEKGLKPGPNNAQVLYAREYGLWKLVVPEEDVEKYLRKQIMDPESKMPMGRDSAYYHMQKTTVGISRRQLYKFLEKQEFLQMSKNIPREQKKGGTKHQKKGNLEMDLIEGKGGDLYENFGPTGNWYWLAIVDCLTGFGSVAMSRRKLPSHIAPKLAVLLDIMEFDLQTKVNEIRCDHGREFYTDVKALCKRRKIKLIQVQKGTRIEKFNQDYQRNFYRLARLHRGTFTALEQQALDITNNTRNKNLKLTPKEALTKPEAQLAAAYNKPGAHESMKPYKDVEPKVGDKCRHLIKERKNIRPMLKIGSISRLYKSYHGRHFTKQVYTIRDVLPKPQPGDAKKIPRRYLVHGQWRHRDQLLIISGTDAETERQVAARAAN